MKQILTLSLIGVAAAATAGVAPARLQSLTVGEMKENARPIARVENADLHDLPMIEELPEGVTDALYARDSYFFAVDGWGQMYSSRDYGMATYVAVSDTEVYIRDPFAGRPTGTWLKGEREGDKVSVTFPQKMLVETYPDWEQDPEGDLGITITDYYYAYKFTLKQGEDKSSFEIDSENPVITFTISDGELKQEGDAFIGMVGEYRMYDKDNNPYTGFNWMGFADGQLEYSKVTAKYEEAPADLTFEKWILDNQGDLTFVDMATSGEDVYIKGFIQTEYNGERIFPAIKGTLKDGKLVFDSTQYLGVDPRYDHVAYFMPGTYEEGVPSEDEWEVENIYYPASSITFAYDEVNKTFTCSEGEALVISALPDRTFVILALDEPVLRWQDMSTPLVPCTPTDLMYKYWEEYEYGAVGFSLSSESEDGRLMDLSNLYYTLYIDGDEFTFYPDEYWDLEEPMTDVPYDYWDSAINAFGDEHEVLLYVQNIETIGVKAKYVNLDGEVTTSEMATLSVSGVNEVAAGEPVKTEWYDLQGRRLTAPAEGLMIRRDIDAEGNIVVRKVMTYKR